MDISNILQIAGNIAIGAGIAFMLFGAVNLFRFKDFYPRILVTSKIDTVGLLTLLIGICLHNGISFFTGKVLLITIIILILNPMVAHIVARSAYLAGYQLEGQLVDDSETDSSKGE
ncbi:MAG: monovalent cation/H(+) antiporter subunit G [Defluviitaleaceae bacterium]|nr:monovalent cation/H(+) antiporter subunit G [Defluviitaleaceae bacterium]